MHALTAGNLESLIGEEQRSVLDSEIPMLSNCDYSIPNIVRDFTVQQDLQRSMSDIVYRSRTIVNLATLQQKVESIPWGLNAMPLST